MNRVFQAVPSMWQFFLSKPNLRLFVVVAVLLLFTNIPGNTQAPFIFKDVTKESGLSPELNVINGHAASWGDADGDGYSDLYIGTFHKTGFKPNLFFKNKKGKFTIHRQPSLEISSRTTGMVFADLDNDGDLDIYIGSMPHVKDKSYPKAIVGNSLFRNDGKGNYTDISKGNAACPAEFGGRSVTVFDYNGDGYLDILAGEDPVKGYSGSKTKSSRLFKNTGNLKFQDVSHDVGIPPEIPAYGVAVADINLDGWPDFFLAANDGGNLLFINDGKGKFVEAASTRQVFAWKNLGESDMICGVSFGDVNRDGLPDMLMGPHFDRPWINHQPVRLFLNQSSKEKVVFKEITEAAGLRPIAMKAPHVEIQDFNNDGWPDIYASVVKFKSGKAHPYIAKHIGVKDGVPQFLDASMNVNNFPDSADLKMKRGATQLFYDKMIAEKKIFYAAAGPSADFNQDGKLDLFLPSWWPEMTSMLLENQTPGGNWIQIAVKGTKGVNSMGIGSRINIYRPGQVGQTAGLLGSREISTGYGYASGQPAIAHFGLGTEKLVDIELILPHNNGTIIKKNLNVNRLWTLGN